MSDSPTHPAWVVARANTMAQLRGWTPFTSIQVEYNLVERSAERELLAHGKGNGYRRLRSGLLLQGGLLTGKYNAQTQRTEDGGYMKAP